MYPVIHIGPLAFYTFGLVLGLAVCLGWRTFASFFRTHGLPVDEPVLGACIVGFGFLGAKLDSALVSTLSSDHRHDSVIALITDPQGGSTYLGSVLCGTLAALVYAWLRGLPLLRFADSLFCIAPAYALGRVGCFLAGDGDYGLPSNLPWAMSFPHGIVPTTARVHPTMLYSSAWELAVFAVLWRLSNLHRRTPLAPGVLLGSYLVATSAFRFLVEYLSHNPIITFGLKEAQLVSVLMLLAGAACLVRALGESRRNLYASLVQDTASTPQVPATTH